MLGRNRRKYSLLNSFFNLTENVQSLVNNFFYEYVLKYIHNIGIYYLCFTIYKKMQISQ